MVTSLTEFSESCSQRIKISGALETHEAHTSHTGHPKQVCSVVCSFKVCKVGVIFSDSIELLAKLIH